MSPMPATNQPTPGEAAGGKEAPLAASTSQSGYSISVRTDKMYLCAFRDRDDCSFGRAVVWDSDGFGACGAHHRLLVLGKTQ